MTAPLVFIDTETTGLHADRRPWEIAMIRRDSEHGQRQRTIQIEDVDLSTAELIGLNIGRFYDRHVMHNFLGPIALAAHRERGFLVKEREAARIVEEWTRGAHIVGAVPNFDTETLAAMLRRHGLCPSWHYHLIDVESLAVGWLHAKGASAEGSPDALSLPWKSDALSRTCGVEPPTEEERHTAMGDAQWAMRLYDRITDGEAL